MTTQEHMVAVVEPTLDGETTIEIAKETVARGGRATVVVLLSRETTSAIAAFADAENLTFADAREVYLERLVGGYANRFEGLGSVTIIADGPAANRVVFDTATRDAATSVVMPQRLVNRRKWKSSVAKSQIPVLIAPPRAA